MHVLLNLTAWKAAARRRMAGWSTFAGWCMIMCDASQRLGGSLDCLETTVKRKSNFVNHGTHLRSQLSRGQWGRKGDKLVEMGVRPVNFANAAFKKRRMTRSNVRLWASRAGGGGGGINPPPPPPDSRNIDLKTILKTCLLTWGNYKVQNGAKQGPLGSYKSQYCFTVRQMIQ